MTSLMRVAGIGFHTVQETAPIHFRCLSTAVSRQLAERVLFSSTVSNAKIRTYSVASGYPRTTIDRGKPTFIKLHEGTNKEKTERVFLHTLENALRNFDFVEAALPPRKSWRLLQDHLSEHHSRQLPPFNPEDSFKNVKALLNLFNRPLIKENRIVDNPTLPDYILTSTELAWGFDDRVGVPFTRRDIGVTTDLSKIQDILDQCPFPDALPRTHEKLPEMDQKVQFYSLLTGEKDAAAATLLTTPFLDETTLLHEVGCWNGQNLFNLLFYAARKARVPRYCLGTDINYRALTMAHSVSSLLSMQEPFIQFRLSNALYPPDLNCLHINFDKEVRLVLRLIPILEPSRAKTFLLKTRSSLKNSKDVVIVSYAVPKGLMYEQNIGRVSDSKQPQYTKEDFPRGVVFLQEFSPIEDLPLYLQESQNHRVILNTYYTEEGFSSLVQECGFKIQHAISVHDTDNDRVVVVLSPE